MDIRTRLALLAGVPPLVAVAPATALLLVAGDRLPDPIADHFGLSGAANGYSGRGSIIALQIALAVGLGLVFGLLAWRAPPRSDASRVDPGRFPVGLSWGMAGLLGVLLWCTTAANLDLPDPAAAVLPGWTFPLALSTAAAAGAVGWWVAPRGPVTPTPDVEPASSLPLGPTEQVSWSRTVTAPGMLALGAAVTAGGIALTTIVGWLGLLAVAAGLLVLLFGTARTTVDRRGLTVAFGPFGVPRLHVPAADVTSAAAVDVSAASFGGWGYRVRPDATGVILRSGPGVRVTRRSGRPFTVTVDDPGTAAGLLNGLTGRPRC